MSTTRYAVEYDDRYVIPLENRAISRCYVDTALGIQFFEDGPETTIRIEGYFSLISEDQEQKLQVSQFEKLGVVFSMVGKTVVSAAAYKNGRLEILFKNGVQLLVDKDPKYEAWELSGTDGLHLVSQPGGGLSVWQPLK